MLIVKMIDFEKLLHSSSNTSYHKEQRCVRFGDGGEGGGGGGVVGSIDGPYEALGCVLYCFLVIFTNEKELVTDGPTDGHTLI